MRLEGGGRSLQYKSWLTKCGHPQEPVDSDKRLQAAIAFDAELKLRPSDSADESVDAMVESFFAWVSKYVEAAGAGFVAIMEEGSKDKAIFDKDGYLARNDNIQRTDNQLATLLGLGLMTNGNFLQASSVGRSIKLLVYLMASAPVKYLIEAGPDSDNEITDVAMLESLAELLSRLRSMEARTLQTLKLDSHALKRWVECGAALAERSTGSIVRPKIDTVAAIIFKCAKYWEVDEQSGAFKVSDFVMNADIKDFSDCAASTGPSSNIATVDVQMVHIENICVAVQKMHIATVLKTAWMITKVRMIGSAVQLWLDTVPGMHSSRKRLLPSSGRDCFVPLPVGISFVTDAWPAGNVLSQHHLKAFAFLQPWPPSYHSRTELIS